MSRKAKRHVLGLLVLALILRLGVAFSFGPFVEPDSFTYTNLARNMVSGRGYIDTRDFRILDASMTVPPAYPAFLAAIFFVVGFHDQVVVAIQQILGALVVVLTYFIGTKLFGARTGFWSALILSLHPWLILIGSALMTEALFTFLLAGSMLFLVTGLSGGKTLHFVLAGGALGLAILCRASFQLYILLIPAVFTIINKDFRSVMKRFLAFLTPVLVLLSAWGLWNLRTHGFFGLTAVGGINFLTGLDPTAQSYDSRYPVEKALREACGKQTSPTIASVLPPPSSGRMVFGSGTVFCTNLAAKILLTQGRTLPEIDRDFKTVAFNHIRQAPFRYLKRCLWNGLTLWSGYQTEWLGGAFDQEFSKNTRAGEHFVVAVKIVFRCLFGLALLILTALGVWTVLTKGPVLGWIPISALVYITVICAVFNLGFIRYRIPLEPYIIMMCVHGLAHIGRHSRL